jgi:hypothetical protein
MEEIPLTPRASEGLINRMPLVGMALGAALAAVAALLTFPSSTRRLAAGAFILGAIASIGFGLLARSRRRAASTGGAVPRRAYAFAPLALVAGLAAVAVPGTSSYVAEVVSAGFGAFFLGGWPVRLALAAIPTAWIALLLAGIGSKAGRLIVGLAGASAVAFALLVAPQVGAGLARVGDRLWPAAAAMAGQPMPDGVFVDVAGQNRRFAEFRGKILLVNVWRTW